MADLSAVAAQIRSVLPVFERVMAIVNYQPPQGWTDLKTMTEPATITALQSTRHITDQWKHIRDSLNTNRNRLTTAAATLPTAWNAQAQQKTAEHAGQLEHNLDVLEGACDQVTKALDQKRADEHTFIAGCAALLIGSVTIVSAAVMTGNIAAVIGAVVGALVALSVAFDLMISRYTKDVRAYDQAVQFAGGDCAALVWP
ncbi:MAG TPA: hypothetical protein VHC49_23490 [Mycobacteriales bacterium]|nr:hypothetical protein [Mycobacteriales bacterium]